MKTARIELPRRLRIQDLFRDFAAGTGRNVKPEFEYLRRPFWHHRADGRTWTVAGDGRAFIWGAQKVPGFADYVVPPSGFGHLSVPGVLGLFKPTQTGLLAPVPLGSIEGRVCDTLLIVQQPAVIRRIDLARLQLLDRCDLGRGEEYFLNGRPVGWKYVSFSGNFGGVPLCGVVMCELPPVLKLAKTRKRKALQRSKKA